MAVPAEHPEPGSPHAAAQGSYTYDATVAPASTDEMVELLTGGEVEVLGLMPWSSNGTYLVEVRCGSDHAPAVYKPERGERPLWDFPSGLWRREVATWELSEVLGYDLVPPTVAREDTPGGQGSLQAFVPARFDQHYFTIMQGGDPAHTDALRRLCVLDILANSADRKGGHCLLDAEDHLWAIDNGLCFHEEFKLRTVLWDFAHEDVPHEILDPVERLVEAVVPDRLSRWLTPAEVDGVRTRAAGLLAVRRFPHDPSGRRWPWPLV